MGFWFDKKNTLFFNFTHLSQRQIKLCKTSSASKVFLLHGKETAQSLFSIRMGKVAGELNKRNLTKKGNTNWNIHRMGSICDEDVDPILVPC